MPCGVSAAVGYDQTSDITSESINESNTATVDNKQTNDVISEPMNFLPNKRGFKLAFLNITSLIKHLDELRVLLVDSPVDVLAINETRLDSNITDNEVHISGYEIVRRDRNINGRYGGGVCFYVRSIINVLPRHDLSIDQIENLCIEIRKPSSKPFLVTTWYRPPDSAVDKFQYFETLVGKLDAENVEFYVLGDLNCNLKSATLDHNSNLLTNIANLFNLRQLIDESTRITESSSTLIDVIFTNVPDKIVCSGVSHIGISDHSLVYAFRKLSTGFSSRGHSTVTYRNFKNFNSTNFRNDMRQQNWDDILNYDDPNNMWHVWKDTFNNVAERHAPLQTKRVRVSKSPWITPELKQCMHERDVLKIKASRSNDPDDWKVFKRSRNLVNSEIKNAKALYYANALHENKNNLKKTWNIINELTSRKQYNSHVSELKVNGSSITNPQELSNEFNDYFVNIGPKLADKITCNQNTNSYMEYLEPLDNGINFQMKTITSSNVFSMLSKLSKSKATGLDRISARLLRECPDLIADSLCLIFNHSINSGVFPDEWKCSKVIPLFKQGERHDPNNYRPISIIPVVAKVFERIIYDQVKAFIDENKLFFKSQSGFRSLHSTVTALLEATNDWAYNIDCGNVNAVVFLDLKKAFDTVDHEILVSKLNAYGIRHGANDWFKSYLSDRTQKSLVNGFLSEDRFISCGVPQGTILGPLLFLLYINDLPNCLKHSHPRMFADDTHLTYSAANVHDIDQNLNQDLKSVSEWLAANKLTLNTSKTEFMLIGSRQRIRTFHSFPTLTINETPIKRVDCVKSLGLNIDENLSWNKHIDKISKKIASGIGALKRMRPFVPSSTLKYIYSSIIQPHFDYCCVVWDNCSKSSADKLQKLQNRAARILTFSSYDTNADLLIKKLGWRKLDSQRKIQKVTMVYKSLNGLNPDYLQPLFNYRNSVINYTLRDTEGKLTVPMPRTNYLKNSFGYSGAELWNNLPIHVRQAVTLKQFKAGCSSYFI